MVNNLLKEPVKLAGESIKEGVVHWLIENFILFRLQCFKNNPRSNYLLIKSIGTIFSIYILTSLLCIVLYYFIPVSYEPKHNPSIYQFNHQGFCFP